MELLHHINIVQAEISVPAPAHVLQAAGHILLPVEVIGRVAPGGQGLVGVADHGLHRLLGGQPAPVGEQVCALLQRQGMDRDVGGIQRQDPVQRIGKARRIISRQAGDQIHVDAGKAGGNSLAEGPLHICRRVPAAHVLQDPVVHGLGIDAHTVGSQGSDQGQLLLIQGVGPSTLHRIFYQPGPVKMPVNLFHQQANLFGGQDCGCAAADVEGPDVLPGPPQGLPHRLNLPQQAVQIGSQQLAGAAGGLTHKGAIGAAGGTEGNAHVDGNVPGLKKPGSLHRKAAGGHTELSPLRAHKEGLLQQPVRLGGTAAGQQAAGGQLGGPDPGQGPPGRGRRQMGQGSQIVAPLQDPPPQGIGLLFQSQPLDGPGGDSIPGDPGGGGQKPLSPTEPGHSPVPPEGRLAVFHWLQRKQTELELLQGIAVSVTRKVKLHGSHS